jgi:hypothetical protein
MVNILALTAQLRSEILPVRGTRLAHLDVTIPQDESIFVTVLAQFHSKM